MSFEVTFVDRDDFLYVHVTGSNSADSVVGYMARVREECSKRVCHRVLIDEDLEGPRLDII